MRSRLFKFVLVSALILGVALVAAELTLRAFPTLRPSHAQQRIAALYSGETRGPPWYVVDDELGFLGRPSRRDTIDGHTLQSDRFGFANVEPWPDRVDVLFLGDSLLEGVGVGNEGQFTTLVAERLPGHPVINLGLPGASPEHQLRVFRRFGAPLHPKLVVACLYVASDVDNAKHFDAWERAGRQWDYEEFRRNHYWRIRPEIAGTAGPGTGDGGEVPAVRPKVGLKDGIRRAINATAVGSELLYVLDPWRNGQLHDVAFPDGSKVFLYERFQDRLEQGMGTDYPAIPEIFFGPLVELRSAVEAAGASLVVALIPSKEEIFHAEGNAATQRVVTEVRQHLDGLGMPVIDLYPSIRETGRRTAPFQAYDIHLSAAGHAAVANAIAKWIEDSGAFGP